MVDLQMNKSLSVIKAISNESNKLPISQWRWSNRINGRKTASFYENNVQYKMSFTLDYGQVWNVVTESGADDDNAPTNKIASTIIVIINEFFEEADPQKVTFTFLGNHFKPVSDIVMSDLEKSKKDYDITINSSGRSITLLKNGQ